jgi:hypothetical protein
MASKTVAATPKRRAARRDRKPATPAGDNGRKAETMRLYGDKALKRLAWLMENADSEPAQVAAAKELLDRVAGRPAATGDGDARAGLDDVVARLRAMRPGKRDG